MTHFFKNISLAGMFLFCGCSFDLTDIFLPAPPANLSITSTIPNPFRDTLQINYSVASAGMFEHLTIVILDRSGKVLATPVDEKPADGQHSFTWDGRNGKGAMIGGGFYFMEMRGWYSDDRPMSRIMVFREGR